MRIKVVRYLCLFSIACLLTSANATSRLQQPAAPANIDEIIKKFAAAESDNAKARNQYIFTQEVDVQSIGAANSITGRYHRISDIVYDDRGQRIEKITYFPLSTLRRFTITKEDLQDIAGVQPFALTLEALPNYQVDYVGREKIDEIDTYVFTVKPKKILKDERYFQGRVWVDTQDLQIVKAAGNSVPEIKGQVFPPFEAYRENIDEKYWFPTYVLAEYAESKDTGVALRMIVKYTNYKKFSGFIRVGEGGGEAPEEDQPKPGQKKPNEPPKPPNN